MFCIDKNGKISLTKGDTATMYVEAFDLNGIPYEIKSTDVVTMTVKKNASSVASLTKTTDSEHYITIFSEDTANLEPGIYVYDVQIKTEDGYVYTIIPLSYFQLAGEVSNNG